MLKEVEGNELRVSHDLVCSRVLEQLVQLCTTTQLTKLFASFIPYLESMLTNRFASHVLQMVVLTVAPLIVGGDEPDEEIMGDGTVAPGEGVTLITLFNFLCLTFQKDTPGYMQDTYSSHVRCPSLSSNQHPLATTPCRTLVLAMSGVRFWTGFCSSPCQ